MPLTASPTGLLRPSHSCQLEWVPHVELPDTCLYGSYFLLRERVLYLLTHESPGMPFAHFPIALQVSPLGQDNMVVLTEPYRDPGLALAVPSGEFTLCSSSLRLKYGPALRQPFLMLRPSSVLVRQESATSRGCFVAGLRLGSEFPIAGGICLCL